MTLSISDLRIVKPGIPQSRSVSFDDLASLEGAERQWYCSGHQMHYSTLVPCGHDNPTCGWRIVIPLPSVSDGAVEVRDTNLLAVKEEE